MIECDVLILKEREGEFLNWYTNEPMPYLPWFSDRPYSSATSHNYIMTIIQFHNLNKNQSHINTEKNKQQKGKVSTLAPQTHQTKEPLYGV